MAHAARIASNDHETLRAAPRIMQDSVDRAGIAVPFTGCLRRIGLDGDDIVRLLAPTVTRYLTADAGELGLPEL